MTFPVVLSYLVGLAYLGLLLGVLAVLVPCLLHLATFVFPETAPLFNTALTTTGISATVGVWFRWQREGGILPILPNLFGQVAHHLAYVAIALLATGVVQEPSASPEALRTFYFWAFTIAALALRVSKEVSFLLGYRDSAPGRLVNLRGLHTRVTRRRAERAARRRANPDRL